MSCSLPEVFFSDVNPRLVTPFAHATRSSTRITPRPNYLSSRPSALLRLRPIFSRERHLSYASNLPSLLSNARTTEAGRCIAFKLPSARSFSSTHRRWQAEPINLPPTVPRCPPLEDFKRRVSAGTVTTDDARMCVLQAYSSIQHLPLEKRREVCQEMRVRGQVLNWLWQNHPPSNDSLYDDAEFSTALYWFLIPQGLEEFIWDWATVHIRTAQDQLRRNAIPITGARWLGQMLARLGEAHLHWAPGGLPHNALRCCQRATDLPYLIPGRKRTAFIVQLYTLLKQILQEDLCLPCDPALFDWFRQEMVDLAQYPGDSRHTEDRATLLLYHPMSADAQPFFEHLRGAPSLDRALLSHARKLAQNAMASHVLCACYIARLQGLVADALWLEEIARIRIPRVWAMRGKVYRKLECDARLHGLRARADPRNLPVVPEDDRMRKQVSNPWKS